MDGNEVVSVDPSGLSVSANLSQLSYPDELEPDSGTISLYCYFLILFSSFFYSSAADNGCDTYTKQTLRAGYICKCPSKAKRQNTKPHGICSFRSKC